MKGAIRCVSSWLRREMKEKSIRCIVVVCSGDKNRGSSLAQT